LPRDIFAARRDGMHTDNPRGIAYMVAAMALFVGNDALMKYASETLPVGQTIFIRGLLVTGFMAAVAAGQNHLKHWRAMAHRDVLVRAACEGIGSYGYLIALAHIPLAIALAINMAGPLAVVPFAVLLLKERIGWRRWTALAIGFCGVLLVVQPGPGGIDWWALVVLGSTATLALRDVITRRIPPAVPSILVTLAGSAMMTVCGGAIMLYEGWQPPGAAALAAVVGAAVMVGSAMHLLVLGTRIGEASVIAGFRYSALVWGVILGYAIWGDLPGIVAWAGIALIIGAGLYAAHRERVRRASASGT
jgi:drug/metabolite transporter (DMT)-like permease